MSDKRDTTRTANRSVRHNTRGPRTQGLGFQGHQALGMGVGVNFQDNLKLQDELINSRGEMIIHSMGIACPKCRSGDSGDDILRVVDCPRCESGYIYRNPRHIQALITSISASRDLVEGGFVIPGDCIMSTSPKLHPQVTDFDIVRFTWPQPVNDGQVIVRGAQYRRLQNQLGNSANPEDMGGSSVKLAPNEDFLHYHAAEALHVEDEDENIYYQDTDFTFEGKKIRWNNDLPTRNKRVVVKYLAYLEWVVFNPPLERRDVGRNLGPRVILRRRHIVDRQRSEADKLQDVTEPTVNGSNQGATLFSRKVTV